MIHQIDIGSFGSFSALNWKKSIRDDGNNVQSFKRLNVIYGRNYSGKTTLSRIFRALETGKIPPNYITPTFTLYGNKGDVTHSGLAAHSYDVRVYNSDFVKDNLSFLTNQVSGEIKTFAIVGEKNKEIEDSIALIEMKLGSVTGKVGLYYDLEQKLADRDLIRINYKTGSDSLEAKLRTHANDKIKKNRQYGTSVYNIESIRKDITLTKKQGFVALGLEEQSAKLALLNQEALSDISESVSFIFEIESLRAQALTLVSRVITPTKPIQELLNDSVLQLWVKQGISHHREKRETCAFCRQELPDDIWEVLDSHFSKESGELENLLTTCLASVNSEINSIPNFMLLTGQQFYQEERIQFEKLNKTLVEHLNRYKADLEEIKFALEARKANLFQVVSIKPNSYDPEAIAAIVKSIGELIVKSNGKTKTLELDKGKAREALRLTDVAKFAETITYDTELARIGVLENEAGKATKEHSDAALEIVKLEREITDLRGKQKDERKGADRINSLLNHFFGHDGIKLEAKDDLAKTAIKFEITRDGKPAFNLSEGECSLIAFCYFIAKLEEPESKDKELIIYIDDPISSLDGNHIFFMFSLIESLIAKPQKNSDKSNSYRYKQLFISTHNLDFLKYLKKISLPAEKNHGGHQQFLIERSGLASTISLMPSYLRDYVTEFNYLFHQIYKCRNQEFAKVNHEPFYSFGNNLRKFLEAFLFYKYPHHDDKSDSSERLTKFFGDDEMAVILANRLNNELSHLELIFDRSIKPIDIPEIPKLATFVLDKMYAADPHQFNALLRSIGEPERLQ
ncbi:AAA family ATPase [Massilia sp. S19_KUP03_FR1]|uniref:AAA family ATPase n=1 Tax=Massilia sp. S19_KUP03_FR1 TaxID=3025503 RepID=UPI002FCD2602